MVLAFTAISPQPVPWDPAESLRRGRRLGLERRERGE